MRIRSIRKLKVPELTADIEVENTHSYQLDNGWVSHNTVSQLTDAASGIHQRHAKYYIRRVRSDNKDPLTKFMIEKGFPNEPDHFKSSSMTIFSFPIKSPENSIVRDDVNAVEHLNLWLKYQQHYCEHKPSVTVSVKEEEWPRVGGWVYDNFDEISGISFLPYDGGTYKQAPYEEITEDKYNELLANMPTEVNWDELIEDNDNVEGTQQLACVAGSCEL